MMNLNEFLEQDIDKATQERLVKAATDILTNALQAVGGNHGQAIAIMLLAAGSACAAAGVTKQLMTETIQTYFVGATHAGKGVSPFHEKPLPGAQSN